MSFAPIPPQLGDELVFPIHWLWTNLKLAALAASSLALCAAALAGQDLRWLLPLLVLLPAMVWLLAYARTAAIVVRGFELVVRSGGLSYRERSDDLAQVRLDYIASPLGRLLGYEHITCHIGGHPVTIRCVGHAARLKREIQHRRVLWQTLTASRVQVNVTDLSRRTR
jgi:hypothetical protein